MAAITTKDLMFDPLKNVDLSTRLNTEQPSVGEAIEAIPVGATVRAAHGLNTEAVARQNTLAQKMQLPMGTVRRHFTEAQQQDMIRRIEAKPELAAFTSQSPERAALYIDDPDTWDVVWARISNMPEAIGQAWDIGKHNQQYAALGREFMDAPEDKLEALRTRMAAHRKAGQAKLPVDSYADEIALTSAVEQLPRMAEMLPKQAGAAAVGGAGGFVAGSVVPGWGSFAGAVTGARTGWLAATAYTAFESERDSTIADFALLKDEDGQYMSRDDVVGAATIYAAGAAAIETAGEAFFLSLAKPFLGSLAGKIAPKAFMKTAVQRAMENKSTRAALMDIAKRVGQNALGEGTEESLQGLLQDVMQVVAMAKSDEGGNTSFGPQTVFKTETAKNLVQNFGAGFGAGLWLGGVPMITLGAQDVVAAHRANLWAREQKALHAEVEATKVKRASPELTQAMLEEGPRLEGNAVIPADALMELHQQDQIILQALGMEEKAVQQAAEMGQELTVPLARLHANLDQKQADAVLDIAREEPQAMSEAESRKLTDRLRAMGERALAETAGRTEELRERDMEVERLREEMTRAVDSVPGMRARLESGEGLQGEAVGVSQFVEDNLRVAVGMARYLADETGKPIAEYLRPITYEGLDVNSRGQLVPVYKIREAMETEEERARAEADRPFWELVWGRLDPESLKADYAETYKELRKAKRGLFMPAGRGGVPLDQIAAELNERGIFTGSADDLLELLKTKERPKRGYYQEDTEEQTEEAKRIAAEIDALAAGYERVLNTPLEGEADEVLASIGREDIEEAFDVLHGPAIEEGGEIIVQGKKLKAKTGSKGYGLVKIVFRHGEKGNKTPDMPIITKEDVLRLPELVREYAPAVNAETTTTWRIPRSDDLVLVIGTSREKDASRLVTMYVDKAGNLPLSEKRKPAAGSSGSKVDNTGDTAHGPTIPHESQEAGLEGSIKQNGEEVNSLYQRDIPENPLVTVHNLDGAALLFADSLGGLPAPSLGVTKADSAYSFFGDITLIGTRDMVDPATTPVFSNDAYTARFPAIDAERKPEGGLNLWHRLRQFAIPEFSYFDRRLEHSLLDGEDDRKAVENKLLRAPSVMRAFLVENGMEVPDVRRPAEETAKHSMQPEVQAVVESLGPIERGWFDENSDTHKKVSEAYMAAERRINGQQEKPKSIFAKIFGPKEGLLPYEQAKRLVKAAEQDKNRIGKEELDDRATITNMRKIVDEHAIDYQAYLNSLLDVVFQVPTVKVGKKKLPVTLENLVKAMTQNQLVRGEESSDIVSAGAVRAMASTRFKSMEELQANRSKVAAGEEVWPLERASNEAMADFRQLAAHEHATPSEAAAYNDVMTALAEAASKQPDKEALRQALQRHGVAEPSEEVLAAGMATLEQAQNILVEYFEAKPQRAVQLSEFRGALVPDTVSDEVLAVLENHGIPVQMYDAQQPTSRQQAVRNMAYELAREDAGVLYQFIGEEGAARLDQAEEASTRMDNLAVAREMEQAKKDAAVIKLATGWERGADGKWRYELDDSYASMNVLYPDMQGPLASSLLSDQQADELAEKLEIARRVQANPEATMAELFGEDGPKVQRMLFELGNLDQFVAQTAALLEGDELTLGAILDHEELFAAYPQLREVRVRIIDDEQNAHGSYNRTDDQITLNKAALDDTSLLMHEVQHAIQDREGFARGGNDKTARRLAVKPLQELLELVGEEAETYARNAEELAAIEFGLDRIRFAEKPSLFEKTGEYLRVKPFAMPKDKKERAAAMEAMVGEWIQERSAEFRSLGHGWWAEYAEKQELVEARKRLQAANRKLAQSSKDAARANQLLDKLEGMSDYDIYHSLAGEVEARNTARRMGMTYEERLNSLASETEDVARKDQIFLTSAFGQAMAMAQPEAQRKAVTRGETVFTPNAMGMDYVVRLFRHANLSTLVHESAHVFFLQMKQLVDSGEASPRMQADYAAMCKWVGSKDGYLNRDQHEKLAKGMELFLREGKAPSKKLEGCFGRFRRWLTEVYKAITGPYFQDAQGRQITLNPEVRDVFSRILATAEEVARQAADEVIGRDFTAELDRLGVTGAQRVAITGLVKEAKDEAESKLQAARDAGRKAMQAKWRKEAEEQVANERIYKARAAMRKSGINMVALASVVGNGPAGEFFRRLPGIKREGASPWAFAARFGYDTVDQMVDEMLTAPTKAERVQQIIDAKQAEHDAQYKAQSLIGSDQAASMEEMVQDHIIKAMGGKERGVPLAQLKQAAREYLAGLPMDQAVNSGKFRYQAVRLMHLERDAIMRQDFQRALDINFKLRLNMELTRQSQELRDKTLGLARRAQKFTNSKEPNPVCRYAVAFLGIKVGLMPHSKMIDRTAAGKDLDMVKAWANEATEYGYTFEMDPELWYADLNPWRHMSVSYFDRVYRELTQIMTIEQNMRKMDTWQGEQELAAVAGDLAGHILGNDPARQKVGVESDSPKVRKLKKFFNQMLTVGTRLRLWDDDKPLGKAWQLIMRPMQDARADELNRFEKTARQIRQIISEAYSHEELMAMKDKAYDQNLKESVSKEERLLVLLNLGNMGNKNRLMEGFKNVTSRNHWTQTEIDWMLAPLEKKDYDFAQKVWDHFEQYKKERFDQEEKLKGVRPLEVEATPLKTRFGTYRGGYFPIKYDTARGARAASLDKVNKSINPMLPSVAHGAMKDRQDKGLGTPLKLRFSVITDAVAESVHDLAYRQPVIEVAKLLRQRDVQNAMESTQGALVYKQMWDWLNDIAGERPAQNSLDNIASWARSRMAIFAMGFKITTTLAQVSGLLATSTQLGLKYTLRGLHDTFRHGGTWSARAVWEDTKARSVMMKNRLQSFDRDVLALTKDLTEAGSSNAFLDPLFRADDWVKKHAFTLTGWVQLWAADLPTWRGAFAKGMEELGMDEKEAALYADNMVETAQGSGATKDLSEIMRAQGMTQLLTVFYSYFNALYNMFYRSGAMALRKKDMPHVLHTASMALVLWFLEPAITAMLTGKGPDDDEEWWKWWLKEAAQQPFQLIVGVRDISNMIWNSIEGKFGKGYRFSPAADVLEAFGKSALDLGRVIEHSGEDYEKTKKAAKSLARDVGMISGSPLLGAQMQTTLGNMWDWLDGSEEFDLRDLFFTRKK